MAQSFPVAEAQIVALFMEAVAYGIYLVTLGLCARALAWGRAGERRARFNWPLVAVALAMFVFATLDVAFGLRHVLDAFIFYHGSGGPDAEFEDISYWVNVMKVRSRCAARPRIPSLLVLSADSGYPDHDAQIGRAHV